MSDPLTLEEYNRLQAARTITEGFGLGNVFVTVPCPFCCAPEFRKWEILETEQKGAEGAVCKECGRGSKFIFKNVGDGSVIFEMVQTCGIDPPPYLPKIRRVDAPIVPPYPINPHG